MLQSCNKQFRHLIFNHNPMSSEDQFLHVPSHFYVRCHPCAHSACCSVIVISLTEKMLNTEPKLAWDGRMNKIISRCALCFHFIKYKYHGGQKPPWVLAAVEVRRLPQGFWSETNLPRTGCQDPNIKWAVIPREALPSFIVCTNSDTVVLCAGEMCSQSPGEHPQLGSTTP